MVGADCVLEWALARLERHSPPAGPARPVDAHVHTGNYLVEGGELTPELERELADLDPLKDLGRMLGKHLRFGVHERDSGRIGSREALFAGYRSGTSSNLREWPTAR